MNCAVIPPHNLLLQSCMPKDNCAVLGRKAVIQVV